MKHLVNSIKRHGVILLIYLANLFLSFHYFTTAYVNSSLLGIHISTDSISLLYMVASLLNIAVLFSISVFLKVFGNYFLTLIFATLDLVAVFGLAFTSDPALILPLFVLHQALVPLILFNLDVFLEHVTQNDNSTGETRGIFLTVANIALVLSPLFLAWLGIGEHDFSKAYLMSGLFLTPLIFIVAISMREFKDNIYNSFNFLQVLKTFFKNTNLRSVFLANLFLSIFYVFMVIYMPIYLTTVVGFSWQEFSLMLSIALLPFLLFELPAGALADHKLGEKEMMALGFIVISASLILLSYPTEPHFVVFAAILFMSRLGAALVEITTESYFFKQTKEKDADLMGIFRMSRPFSYLVGPLLGGLALLVTNYQMMFIGLSIIMLSGLFIVFKITDTR